MPSSILSASRPASWRPVGSSNNFVRPGPRLVLPEAERIRSEAAMKALAEDLRMFQIMERSEFIIMPKFRKQEKAMMKWLALGKDQGIPLRESPSGSGGTSDQVCVDVDDPEADRVENDLESQGYQMTEEFEQSDNEEHYVDNDQTDAYYADGPCTYQY
ncbi:hypothetical protein N5P37_005467 [Trichoderma harzianum]|uniref:Uncharacterized protein n=1 Tax=Trichoderma harzianum CBS 226.95 TaxID=983964 RepID=A0A2T4ABT6_TRIHA|nr:hypothetical protein M431DRAFT_16520 [Trichoderma harzianum CBS 226.95]KAK0762649.1 hypothetical protein N5P37_005467 [Trichoderma harzianum]PTB54549.1 hypothetical protein M431DRAFT_16520 [Trichoderma harzianum CBS 226.95]